MSHGTFVANLSAIVKIVKEFYHKIKKVIRGLLLVHQSEIAYKVLLNRKITFPPSDFSSQVLKQRKKLYNFEDKQKDGYSFEEKEIVEMISKKYQGNQI
jgi:hypothetical protein